MVGGMFREMTSHSRHSPIDNWSWEEVRRPSHRESMRASGLVRTCALPRSLASSQDRRVKTSPEGEAEEIDDGAHAPLGDPVVAS